MKESKIKFYHEPICNVGDTIYVIDQPVINPNNTQGYKETQVCSFVCEYTASEKNEYLVVTGYKTMTLWLNSYWDNCGVPPNHICKTVEAAEKWSAWHPVDLPFEVYQKALGISEDAERINYDDTDGLVDTEDSDLGICCGDISEIRDKLIKCYKQKGLIFADVNIIMTLAQGHGIGDGKHLCKILSALGIKEEELELNEEEDDDEEED